MQGIMIRTHQAAKRAWLMIALAGIGFSFLKPVWGGHPETKRGIGFRPDPVEMQTALAQADLYDDAIDGIVGPKTREAIREFQRLNELTADGVCGFRTWEKLKSYLPQEESLLEAPDPETPPPDIDPSTIVLPPEPELSARDLKRKLVP